MTYFLLPYYKMDRLRYNMDIGDAAGGSGPDSVKYYGVGNPKLFDVVLGAMHQYLEGVVPRFRREPVEVRDIWMENSVLRLQTDRGLVRLRRKTLIGVGIDLLVRQNADTDSREMVGRVSEGDFSEIGVPSGYELFQESMENDRYQWFLFTQRSGF